MLKLLAGGTVHYQITTNTWVHSQHSHQKCSRGQRPNAVLTINIIGGGNLFNKKFIFLSINISLIHSRRITSTSDLYLFVCHISAEYAFLHVKRVTINEACPECKDTTRVGRYGILYGYYGNTAVDLDPLPVSRVSFDSGRTSFD